MALTSKVAIRRDHSDMPGAIDPPSGLTDPYVTDDGSGPSWADRDHGLDYHNDVDLTGLADDDFLRWDSVGGMWEPHDLTAADIDVVDSAGHFDATDVEAALAEAYDDFEAHVAQATDAHDASAISVLDSGALYVATDVEAALAEVMTDVDADEAAFAAHAADASAHHTRYADSEADARIAAAVLDDLSDVTETTITTGDLLRWNGSAWVNYADSNYESAGSTATHAAITDAHHTKYTDAEAVDAVEAVGTAVPVSTDTVVFSDAGVLKRVAFSGLDETILTGLTVGASDHGALTGLSDDDHPQYIHGDAFIAKGDILGGTGTGTYANTPIGVDGNFLVADSGESEGLIWRDIADADIPSTIARDSEVTSEISTHTSNASAHHTKYTDAEAIAAVEGEATLDLTGAVTSAGSLAVDHDLTATTGDTHNLGEWTSTFADLFARWISLRALQSAHAPGIEMYRERAGSTTVVATDWIGEWDMYAWDGVSNLSGPGIYGQVDSVSVGTMASSLHFRDGSWADTWLINDDGDFIPGADSAKDIGSSSVRVQQIYTDAVDVAGSITVTGNVDGVDVSAHAANSDAHHAQAHVLDGADHTVSGLTTGHVLQATSATTFGFAAPPAGTPATTVTSEETLGIADAVGTDSEYARQDHTHGTPSAATIISGIESTLDHGSIAGLSDDDHTQYLLADGSRDLSGSLGVSSSDSWEIGDFSNQLAGLYSSLVVIPRVTSASPPTLEFDRAKAGTTALTDNTELGNIEFYGYDGNSYELTARIRARVDGSVADEVVPTEIVFSTTATTSATERWRIAPAGDWEPIADSLYDIGTASLRPATIYADNINSAGAITLGAETITEADWTDLTDGGATTLHSHSAGDHGALTGLTDDDHTQYLLADGTRNLTGSQYTQSLTTTDSTYDIGEEAAAYANVFADTIRATTIQGLGTINSQATTVYTARVRSSDSSDLYIQGGSAAKVYMEDGHDLAPEVDGTSDLGTSSLRFGTTYTDALTVTNNISVGGTVDGVDVAAHAASSTAHHDHTGSGMAPVRNVYTSGTTWNKPTGIAYIEVEVVGGGGGGGGADNTATNEGSSGAGGGGGGYAKKLLTASDLSSASSLTVSVGSGGSAGGTGGTDGGAATASSVSGTGITTVQGNGGSGGNGDPGGTGNVGRTGGSGGGYSGQDIGRQGDDGGPGFRVSFSETAKARPLMTGQGGASMYAGMQATATENNAAPAGKNYGGGGAGASVGPGTGTARAGGAGADGVVIITEYYA